MSRHLWLLLLCGSAAAGEFTLVDRGQPAAASPVLMGITKAALQSESFISAASFQER